MTDLRNLLQPLAYFEIPVFSKRSRKLYNHRRPLQPLPYYDKLSPTPTTHPPTQITPISTHNTNYLRAGKWKPGLRQAEGEVGSLTGRMRHFLLVTYHSFIRSDM